MEAYENAGISSAAWVNPTKWAIGKGTAKKLGGILKSDGISNVMVVTGKHAARKCGALQDVTATLDEAGVHYQVFEGVRSNPELDFAAKVAEAYRSSQKTEHPMQAYIAIGGGSVIDSCKASAMGCMLPESVPTEKLWDFYMTGKAPTKVAPIYVVELLSATGSGCNGGSVLQISLSTNPETAYKAGLVNDILYPRVNLIDPAYQLDLPHHITYNSLTDAMVHVLELLVEPQHPEEIEVTFQMSMAILRSIIITGDRLLKNPHDHVARQNASYACLKALDKSTDAFTKGGVWAAHYIEHAMGAFDPAIAHGAGLSVTFPAFVQIWGERGINIEAFRRIAVEGFGAKLPEAATNEQVWKALAAEFRAVMKRWGMPMTLDDLLHRPATKADRDQLYTIFCRGKGTKRIEDIARAAYDMI